MAPPNFPYTTGIPNPNNRPSQDVPIMQTNANSIASIITSDHVGFNTNGSGWHEQVTFNNISSQTTPTNPISLLYTANDAKGNPQLNFLNSNAFANTAAPSGGVLLLAGIVLQWGTIQFTSFPQTFSFAQSFPNACFSVILTPISVVSVGYFVSAVTKNNFTASEVGGSGTPFYYYIAIGN